MSELNVMGDINTIALQLRRLAVDEWIDYSSQYEVFLSDVCIQQEAPKFLVPSSENPFSPDGRAIYTNRGRGVTSYLPVDISQKKVR